MDERPDPTIELLTIQFNAQSIKIHSINGGYLYDFKFLSLLQANRFKDYLIEEKVCLGSNVFLFEMERGKHKVFFSS
jgi:hypothetical protein